MNPAIPRLSEAERETFYRSIEASPGTLAPYPGDPLIRVAAPDPERELRRFDGAAICERLAPEVRDAFAAAAIELAVARLGTDVARHVREECLFESADVAVGEALDDLATEHVFESGLVPPDQVPGIPSLLGPICRECGCTDHDACWTPLRGDGCSWVEPDLCSACAPAQVRPRTAPAPDARTGA